jgi:mannose-6-phosphate isomerase-like protein (cupin superfamily)
MRRSLNAKYHIEGEEEMPLYKWDRIEDTLITPSRTQSKGKTIRGKSLLLQRILHHEDRGDGHAGAKTHSHPEEQIFIALKGKMKIRAGSEWYTMEEGDVFLMPAGMEHEEVCEGDFLWFNIKSRIPGHSWYDGSWKPGAEKDWEKVKKSYDEMDKKYREKTPWND